MEVLESKLSVVTADAGAVKVVVHYVLRALTWIIVGSAMLVWLVIGFFFWIPLLVRAAISFSVEVVNATLTNRSAEAAGHMLRRAVDFYRSGFVTALEAVQGGHPKRSTYGEAEPEELGISPRGFLNELGWTVLIWYLVGSALGWTTWTPVRAVAAFLDVEWARHFSILWYSFTSWLGGFGF